MATILAIETSCDETAIAIVKNREVLSSIITDQIALHNQYGGVVPEIASREHLIKINPALDQVFLSLDLGWSQIDAIAATVAPGLVGSLLIGVTVAKSLALIYDKPFIGVHHLEGHISATYLTNPNLYPPFLCLLVSGGHTSLIYVKDIGVYETLGETRDDAAGEAFDKVARLLKLGYPGGPIIDKLAREGNELAFNFPDGRIKLPDGSYHPYDCSFSGLKTSVLHLVRKLEASNQILPINDIAASFQYRVATSLTSRAIACAQHYGLKAIAVGGGVAANSGLRKELTQKAGEYNIEVIFPPMKFCTDNAAMIGCAAAGHFERDRCSNLDLSVQSRARLEDLLSFYENRIDTN